MSRQYRCIELTGEELLALREIIRPFASTNNVLEESVVIDFCKRMYKGLIRLETNDDLEAINLGMDEEDCLLVNHFLGAEDFGGSLGVLRQTWAVLFEFENEVPPQYDSVSDDLLELVRKEDDEGNSS